MTNRRLAHGRILLDHRRRWQAQELDEPMRDGIVPDDDSEEEDAA